MNIYEDKEGFMYTKPDLSNTSFIRSIDIKRLALERKNSIISVEISYMTVFEAIEILTSIDDFDLAFYLKENFKDDGSLNPNEIRIVPSNLKEDDFEWKNI